MKVDTFIVSFFNSAHTPDLRVTPGRNAQQIDMNRLKEFLFEWPAYTASRGAGPFLFSFHKSPRNSSNLNPAGLVPTGCGLPRKGEEQSCTSWCASPSLDPLGIGSPGIRCFFFRFFKDGFKDPGNAWRVDGSERQPPDSEKVADMACFLASDAASCMTGNAVKTDWGYCLVV